MGSFGVICAVLTIGIFQTTLGLQCIVCNSRFNDECGPTHPSNRYLMECSHNTAQPVERNRKINPLKTAELESIKAKQFDVNTTIATNYTFCRKTITHIPRQQNKGSIREAESVTVRSCGWIGEPEELCKWSAVDGTQTLMCTCLEDTCNSAPSKFGFGHIIGTIIVTFLLVLV